MVEADSAVEKPTLVKNIFLRLIVSPLSLLTLEDLNSDYSRHIKAWTDSILRPRVLLSPDQPYDLTTTS